MELRRLAPFARTHHGLVARAHAAEVGVSRTAWYRAIDRGQLEPVHPNIARLYGHATSRPQAMLAAVLALRHVPDPPSVVLASHRSSAFLLGVERPDDDPIDVTSTPNTLGRCAAWSSTERNISKF